MDYICGRRGRARRLPYMLLAVLAGGCGPRVEPPPPYIPRAEAVGNINDNSAPAAGKRLYMTGNWSGHLTDDRGNREARNGRFWLHVALPSRLF